MAKLRLVQPRKNTVATENDLRGLGQEPLFKATQPNAVLTRKGGSDLSALEDSLRRLEVQVTASHHGEDLQHFSLTAHHDASYKSHAVQLYTLALHLASIDTHSKFALWHTEPLRMAMKDAIDGDPARTLTRTVDDHFPAECMTHETYLYIAAGAVHSLRQAGFTAIPAGDQPLMISRTDAQTRFKEELARLSATGDVKKTG